LFAIVLYLSGQPYSRWVARALLVALVAFGAVVVLWLRPKEPEKLPDVSLVDITYQLDYYNPRRIDLVRAAESGIPVAADHDLEFLDLSVAVDREALQHVVQAEVYQDIELTQLVGSTDYIPLTPGVHALGPVVATRYNVEPKGREGSPDIWRVPEKWIGNPLYVALVTYREGQEKPVAIATTPVRLDPNGDAWFVEPPTGAFALISYRVNSGPTRILDPREIADTGLNALPGDTLTIEEIWYDASATGGTLHVEAYFTGGNAPGETVRVSEPTTNVRKGIRLLNGVPNLQWEIPENPGQLVLSLFREDDAILDVWVISLGGYDGNAGLAPVPPSALYVIRHDDFEDPADLSHWSSAETTSITRTTAIAFTGDAALSVTTTGPSDEATASTRWYQPLRSGYVMGQIYLPPTAGVSVEWAQACLTRGWWCVGLSTDTGRWTSFFLDLDTMGADAEGPGDVGFLLHITGASPTNPYTFYLDDLHAVSAESPIQ
jgi:hypothetical protein